MADFNKSFDRIVSAEGGYQAMKADKGNYVCSDTSWAQGKQGGPYTCQNGAAPSLVGTKYGVAAPTLANYIKRVPTVDEMKNLSLATVKGIYKSDYWDPLQLTYVQSQDLADLIFDGSINQGEPALKSIILKTTGESSISAAVSKLNQDPKLYFSKIQDAREAKYKAIGGAYLSAWLDRLDDYTFTAVEYAKKNKEKVGLFIAISLVLIILAYKYLYKGSKNVSLNLN